MFIASVKSETAGIRKRRGCKATCLTFAVVAGILAWPVVAFPEPPEWTNALLRLVKPGPDIVQKASGDAADTDATTCGTGGASSPESPMNSGRQEISGTAKSGNCAIDTASEDKSRSDPNVGGSHELSPNALAMSAGAGTAGESIQAEMDRRKAEVEGTSDTEVADATGADRAIREHSTASNEDVDAAPVAGLVRDPVTEARSRLLRASGLLERQSEISESILLMERQIRQAELIKNLMELLGPDTPIEIAPGQFRVFRDTPAGHRIAAEMEEGRMQIWKRLINLEREILEARSGVRRQADKASAPEAVVLERRLGKTKASAKPEIRLLEIYGSGNSLTAVVQFDSERLNVGAGSELPNGARVEEVGMGSILTRLAGKVQVYRIGR